MDEVRTIMENKHQKDVDIKSPLELLSRKSLVTFWEALQSGG